VIVVMDSTSVAVAVVVADLEVVAAAVVSHFKYPTAKF
jgi:hypothetical protein